MQITDEDAVFIAENIVSPMIKAVVDELLAKDMETSDKEWEVIEKSILSLADSINNLRLDVIKHVSFFKSVLIAHGLTNEECYKAYLTEWNKLNAHLINSKSDNP